MIKVVIVEDQDLGRRMLSSCLSLFDDICVTADFRTGEDFIAALPSLEVDVVLLDIVLKGYPMQGEDVARHLRRERPDVKILAVSCENNLENVEKMLAAGIDGFLSKNQGQLEELPFAIRGLMNDMAYYTQDISAIMAEMAITENLKRKSKKNHDANSEFTEQELNILDLSREGLQGKEIADRLNVSINTVKKHKQNIYRKLGLNSSAEAVMYAIREGYISI